MKYSTVLSLTAIFTGYVLGADPPSCSTTGDNTPITSGCCPRDSAKRLRRSAREIFARTDSPTCPTPKYYGDSCCTHEFEKPTLVKDTFNLQCGANGVADIVNNAVKVDIVGCDTADDLTKDTCYLMISSTPAGAITDTHLEISTTAWTSTKYPTKDPASWSYTSYCVKTTGVCKVPFNKIGDDASALCGKNLYVAYHTSTSDGTSSKTCTGDGTLIPGQPGNRWWEYLTLAFTCPKVCDRWCCCEQPETPPPPPDCSVTGTAFAKPPSNADQQTLEGKGCGRWGWWNVFSPSSTYEARLLVGAGNNVGGTDVGKVVVSKCGSDPSKLTVTYTLDSPYKLTEVHVDLRCQPITEKSTGRTGTSGYPCAPGQYNVFKAGGKMCPASTGQSSYAISCIDPNVYDDGDNLGYTCTSTTDPMYAIFHASVYNGGADCPVGSCDNTDDGE